MISINALRIFGLILGIIAVISFALKIVRDKHPVARQSRWYTIIATLLLVVASITASWLPTPLIVRVICVITTHQAMMFLYFSFQVLEEPVSFMQLLKNRLSIVTWCLTTITIIFEYLRRNNLGSFIDNEPFIPTLNYYTSYVFFYFPPLLVSSSILYLNWKAWGVSSALMYHSRLLLNMVTFSLIWIGAIVIYLNIGAYILYGDIYRPLINEIYQVIKILVVLSVLSAASITSLVNTASNALRPVQVRRLKQQKREVWFLWKKLTDIVPAVRLSSEPSSALRCLIEIDDAREIIWSHHTHKKYVTARKEAHLIFDLLRSKTIFSDTGVYAPPSTYHRAEKHNHYVVKHLKHLEQRKSNANDIPTSSSDAQYSAASGPSTSGES